LNFDEAADCSLPKLQLLVQAAVRVKAGRDLTALQIAQLAYASVKSKQGLSAFKKLFNILEKATHAN